MRVRRVFRSVYVCALVRARVLASRRFVISHVLARPVCDPRVSENGMWVGAEWREGSVCPLCRGRPRKPRVFSGLSRPLQNH
jgi:hypothetical protein